ncbi:DapH/DapD/GlmU-related protein [Vibrio sp.]|uniref:DapH/DapD/GlmU-related protein n=1 Tax=Vibrio sp. TaxID=678 RepID=UPI003AA819B9
MYQSERILCPNSHSELSEAELMDQYGRYFGLENWVTFSGCPSITLTKVGSQEFESLPKGSEVIAIDSGCYIESSNCPAFPSGITKLTSVSVKDKPFGEIFIGKGCVLQGTSICSYKKVSIGNNVIFGPNVVVMDCSGHALSNRGHSDEFDNLKAEPVTIGNDVWIGYGCIILPGVNIGDGVVIGAGSVVTKNIPANCMAAGNPCTIKKIGLN